MSSRAAFCAAAECATAANIPSASAVRVTARVILQFYSRPRCGFWPPVRVRDEIPPMRESRPLVGVIMGSQSDWETMRHADEILTEFDVAHESRVVSAHRTPAWMAEYATTAA